MHRVAALSLVLVLGCPGRPAVEPPPADLGIVAGRVFKGAVKDAAVTVYRLDGFKRGAVVGTAATDAEGAFRVPVGTSTGPFLVVAVGGSYVDEATGVTVQAGSAELTALVPVFDIETKLEQLRITPISHLAATLALFWAEAEQRPLVDTDAEAWTRLNKHFGGLDWRAVTPRDATASMGATLADDATKAGVLLSAFSMQARLISETAGLTPGGRVNPSTVVSALADDVTADGFFDGVGTRGQLVLPLGGQVKPMAPTATAVDGQTARTALGQALARFITSDRNSTAVTVADVQALVQALSTNADPRLFRGASMEADIEAPIVTWVRPQANAGVRGMVDLELTAADNRELRSLAFTAPAAIAASVPVIAADKTTGRLTATLDVSSLMDGPLELAVKAVDAAGNETTSQRTVVVSQRGPIITVASPATMATVRGVVSVAASAAPQSAGAAITKLELRAPTTGISPDTESSAALFAAQLNTAGLPEGELALSFHAEDSQGGVADLEVPVVVDNLPFGRVEAFVSAGTPLGGAAVKLLAVDATTGLPVTGRVGGAMLGQGVTDAQGVASFMLTQENYAGPVQLEASGAGLSVVDVSDPLPALDGGSPAPISLPATFALTSFVAQYRAGDPLAVHATLYTSLADAAARAYATGRVAGVSAQPLPQALPVVDRLFVGHVSRPRTWALRDVRPAPLALAQPQTLRDAAYAAFPDVALHQLARDLSNDASLTPGTTITAFTLADLLVKDVSDGVFDGREGGQALTVPMYGLDANTSRFRLASALDRWVRGPRNGTSLTRPDMQADGVFDALCTSAPPANPFYPASTAPIPFDSGAPQVSFQVTFTNGTLTDAAPVVVGANAVVAGVVKVVATGVDDSGMRSITVTRAGSSLTDLPNNTAERYAGTFAPSASGLITFTARACDALNNCGNTTVTVLADVDAPMVSVAQPTGQRVRLSVPVDISATDAAGVASLVLSAGFSGLSDTDSAAASFQGTWTVPTGTADGAATGTFRACDVVGNCGTGTASVVVDRTPPSTMVTVTYSRPPLVTGAAPVGASRLIGGAATVEAIASDPAGLASTSVAVAGTTLMPSAGNTAARFQGTYLTSADGPLTFVASACDAVGNCGDTPSVVVVDNTPPVITLVSPAAGGFFSAAVPLEATATDAAGIASGVWQAQPGFTWADQDGTAPRMFGSLAIGSTAPEGAAAGVVEFCDTVANCRTQSVGFSVDRLAPVITITSAPPQYTSGTSVALSVTASDGAGAGVGTVYARVGSGAPVAGTRSGSTWSWSPLSLPPIVGQIAIVLYGVDTASTPNSGDGRAQPSSQTVSVLRDISAAAVALSPYLSWQDEDTLTVLLDGSGVPVMPVVYQPSGPGRSINVTPLPGSIKRAVTRLNDASNRPTLSVSLPYVAGTDAPFTSATWSSTRPCAFGGGCVPAIGGALTQVSRTATNTVFYDLPLALPESGTYDITLSFTDAAGNISTLPQRLTWELVGPPLAIVRDTAWDSYLDPQSVRAASIASRTYQRFFGGAPQPTGNRARVWRYLIYNPAAEPVSAGFDFTVSNRQNIEQWTDVVGDLWQGTQGTFNADGFSFRRMEWFNLDNSSAPDFCTNTNELSYTRPCAVAANGYDQRIRHRRGDTQSAWQCYGNVLDNTGPQNGRANSYSFGAGDLEGQFFTGPAPLGNGNEVTLSQQARFTTALTNNSFGGVVPAAVGNVPGVVAAYVTTTSTGLRPAEALTLSTATLPNLAGSDYKLYFADAFEANPSPAFSDGPNPATCNGFSGPATFPHRALYWYRRLTSAQTQLGGFFRLVSGGGLITRTNPFPAYTYSQSTVSNRIVNLGLSVSTTITH